MVPENGGQQELFSTVLRTNEAEKMDIALGGSLRTSMRTKKRIFWLLGCVTARNVAVWKSRGLMNGICKKMKRFKRKWQISDRRTDVQSRQ